MREKKLIRVLNEIEFETRQGHIGTNIPAPLRILGYFQNHEL